MVSRWRITHGGRDVVGGCVVDVGVDGGGGGRKVTARKGGSRVWVRGKGAVGGLVWSDGGMVTGDGVKWRGGWGWWGLVVDMYAGSLATCAPHLVVTHQRILHTELDAQGKYNSKG